MSDDTFRPQKKITEQEFVGNQERSMPGNQERSMPAVKFTGNPPPAFREAIEGRRVPEERQQQFDNSNDSALGPSIGKLQELIAGIAANSNMAYEEVRLPSRGKFYNGKNGPGDGVVHMRPMTGAEEEILATQRFIKKGAAVDMIFKNCMKEKYDTSNFLTQDRTYMLIYLRAISYTPNYEVEIKDPDSDKTFQYTIDLDSLDTKYCEDDFSVDNLTDVLPVTGYSFKYRLATGKDDQKILEYREKKAKNFDLSEQADDSLLYRTAHLIDEIEGLKNKIEIQTLLKKLPIQDVAYMRTVINDPPFGIETKVTVLNPYTLNEFEIELPLESNFFFPRARKTKKATQA